MRIRVVSAFLLFALASPGSATEYVSPRLVGLAGAGAAGGLGLDALGTNPALLGRGLNSGTFTLFPAGGFLVPMFALGHKSGGRFSTADLNLLLARFQTGTVQESYKQDIVDAINLGSLTFRTEGMIAAVAVRLDEDFTIAAHVAQVASGTYVLEEGVDAIIDTIARTGNAFPVLFRDPVKATAIWYNEYVITGGYAPMNSKGEGFGIGASLKVIQGLGYLSVDGQRLSTRGEGILGIRVMVDYDVRTANGGAFDVNTIPTSPLFTLFPASVGHGYGIDLGVMKSANFSGRLVTAALSITDIGAIVWSDRPAQRSVHRSEVIPTTGSYPVDSLRAYEGVSTPIPAFTTSLATRLRLGLAAEELRPQPYMPGVVMFEYTQGLTTTPGNSTSPRLAVGAEWRRRLWRWSTGLAFNSDEHVSWSIGGGVRAFGRAQIDLAFGRVNGLWEAPVLVNAVARIAWEW